MNLKSIILTLTYLFIVVTVAQKATANVKGRSSQIDTLAPEASGPRSDGGANFVWDPAKKKMVLLDLYLWDRVTEIDPMSFVNNSPRLSHLKQLADLHFYKFSFDFFAKRKGWFLVRDINLEQYPQCINSIKLYVKKKIAACQTSKFIFIDANMFGDADGLSQDGTILHEYGVGLGQLLGRYNNPEDKAEVEFRIQLFVGAAVHGKHTVESIKDFMSQVLRSDYPTKLELEVYAVQFLQGRKELCEAFAKLDRLDLSLTKHSLITQALLTLWESRSQNQVSVFENAQNMLSFFKHPKYGPVSSEDYSPRGLYKLFEYEKFTLAYQRLAQLCSK